MLPAVEESRGYDFLDPEHAEKWRGVFVASLRKVLEQVHPNLTAEESALQYVESLCLRLLTMLCAAPSPLTVQDVEERVARTFPSPLDKWALADARECVAQKKKRGALPLDKVHQMLKEVLLYKVDTSVSTMIAAILEYVSCDVLKLAGNFVRKMSRERCEPVTCRDVEIAMCADKVLMDMFYAEWDARRAAPRPAPPRRASLSYGDLVRDLVADERAFLRDLHLIIRVFKGELEKVTDNTKAISLIFGNIMDIYELTVTLLGSLEDGLEAAHDARQPCVASCFEELAEVEEFRAYVRYTNIVTSRESRDALQNLLEEPLVWERLSTAGHGFHLAVRYLLPRLLLSPARHVLRHHAYVRQLLRLAPAPEDRESFKQVECNLHPIKKLLLKALGNGPKVDGTLRSAARARRQLAIDKCGELSRLIDNWDQRDITHCCNEFIREDTLSKITPGKRTAERRAYLFDGLLLLCKPITSLVGGNSNAAAAAGATQLKLKEKFHVRKVELVDRADTDEAKHLFELVPRVGQPLLLSCGSLAEKRLWMCDLLAVSTRPMLDRTLDSILLDLEKKHPLKLPPPELYRFAVPDSPDNIVLESGQGTLIKGATLLKLVERLTYHVYADLGLVRTFLTTYRSFCSPAELLALLAERFRIPEPSTVYDAPAETVEQAALPASDADKLSKNTAREDWKRYRNEFQQPVKFRVINVIRHWVDQHFYDFEREPALLEQLRSFLQSVGDKPMRKWVASVLKTVTRKSQQAGDPDGPVSHVFDRAPPPPLRHPADPARHNWHPLALHPVELARQLTHLEFTLYRQVRPSELVGAVWTKKDKEKTSPNLLRIIKHTTNFTRWMEKWIVESENVEERVAVASRLLEVAVALHDLNNFNGVLAVVAAFDSAAVHRLKNTYQLLPPRLTRSLDEFRSLNSRHFRRYAERLRSINPPCVPFLGVHLTNILHIEEGNLDFLPNTELINFSKRRKVAEITGEIQQYQNQPYCLTVEPRARSFLESLEPFPGMDDQEITNHLYARSLEIEPRRAGAKQVPKFPRRYPELSLKQLKVSRRDGRHEHHSTSSNDDTLSVSQLSPTGGWDASSLSLCDHDDTRSMTSERGLTSPRLGGSQLTLLDKGLALFDKNAKAHRSNSNREEPPSPRDRHSPRHERSSSLERRPPPSPRDPDPPPAPERVPPLLPRNSVSAAPAPAPLTAPAPAPTVAPSAGGEAPPSPPARPPPSPKHLELRAPPALSPKRSPAPAPAPQPPPSPAFAAESRGLAFKFPLPPSPAPSPSCSPCPAPAAPPPPPLPPRRRRDCAAPSTPKHLVPQSSPAPAPAPAPAPSPAAPPLPPRPPQPPPLLRPAHSAILQRRHHTTNNSNNIAPKLPPKPAPPAVAPRTY